MSQIKLQYRYLVFKDDKSYHRYVQRDASSNDVRNKDSNDSAPATMTHGSYGALLFHPRWKSKRKEILARDMNRCVHCKSDKELQVHHRQYHFIVQQQQFRLPWDYPDHLLITLCESCHSHGHNKYKVPTINV